MTKKLHQQLISVFLLLPLLLVGCKQRGQPDQPGTPQGKSGSMLTTSSRSLMNDKFVRFAETAIDEIKTRIERLKTVSRDISPDIQAALDEQIEVLQEQQQAASQVLNELKRARREAQPYLQAHFMNVWNNIVTSYEAADLLLILITKGTCCVSA